MWVRGGKGLPGARCRGVLAGCSVGWGERRNRLTRIRVGCGTTLLSRIRGTWFRVSFVESLRLGLGSHTLLNSRCKSRLEGGIASRKSCCGFCQRCCSSVAQCRNRMLLAVVPADWVRLRGGHRRSRGSTQQAGCRRPEGKIGHAGGTDETSLTCAHPPRLHVCWWTRLRKGTEGKPTHQYCGNVSRPPSSCQYS